MKESHNFELARLKEKKKKKKKEKHFGCPVIFWLGTFAMFLHATTILVGYETLEDEWYIVIKASKFTVFETSRDCFVFSYIVYLCYPYICLMTL